MRLNAAVNRRFRVRTHAYESQDPPLRGRRWLCVSCRYLGKGLIVRAGEVVLVKVLGIEDGGPLMVGGTR